MGVLVTALTLSVALTREGLVRGLRRLLPHMGRISGGLLIVAGGFVAYYGWAEAHVADNAGIVTRLSSVQGSFQDRLDEFGAGRLGSHPRVDHRDRRGGGLVDAETSGWVAPASDPMDEPAADAARDFGVTDFRTALRPHVPRRAHEHGVHLALVQRSVGPLGFRPDTDVAADQRLSRRAHVALLRTDPTPLGSGLHPRRLGGVPRSAGPAGGLPSATARRGVGAASSSCSVSPTSGSRRISSIGVTVRPGQAEPTPTCGALVSIYDLACRDALPSEVDVADYEATRLALRLVEPR